MFVGIDGNFNYKEVLNHCALMLKKTSLASTEKRQNTRDLNLQTLNNYSLITSTSPKDVLGHSIVNNTYLTSHYHTINSILENLKTSDILFEFQRFIFSSGSNPK